MVLCIIFCILNIDQIVYFRGVEKEPTQTKIGKYLINKLHLGCKILNQLLFMCNIILGWGTAIFCFIIFRAHTVKYISVTQISFLCCPLYIPELYPSHYACTCMYISCLFAVYQVLTHWGQNKMVAILQTTFSNRFSWMKMFEFWLKFHLRVQLTISQHWFR